MAKRDIRKSHIRISEIPPSPESGVSLEEQVFILVSQAFCPRGHDLVKASKHTFDGFPGIALWVSDGKKEGIVELSPFHGDATKEGMSFENGQRLSVRCPICKTELPTVARCGCRSKGAVRKLYLTPDRDEAHLLYVCDVWGCPRSRLIDSFETLSEYIEGNISDIK